MKFIQTSIPGTYTIRLDKHEDGRGFLARTWDKKEFSEHEISFDLLQGYTCTTLKKGTVRGFHFLVPPHEETKLTRVTRGSLYEVVIDLRPNSPTFKKWFGVTLKASDYTMFVIPPGCGHAVLTLEDNTEYIAYYSTYYKAASERGIRHDDPLFAIKWPIPVTIVSQKDRSWPDYDNR